MQEESITTIAFIERLINMILLQEKGMLLINKLNLAALQLLFICILVLKPVVSARI